jgi:hypothetical protein
MGLMVLMVLMPEETGELIGPTAHLDAARAS